MEVGDEVESEKKLDEQRKRLQRQLREIERFTDVQQEVQSCIKRILQQQLQELEQRRNDLLPEHQRVQKRIGRETCKRKLLLLGRRWGRSERDITRKSVAHSSFVRQGQKECSGRSRIQKAQRILLLSDKVEKNAVVGAELEAELQGLQAGEKRGSNASQAVDCCPGDDDGADFRYGSGSGEAQVRGYVPNVLQKIRDPYSSCAYGRENGE